MQWPTFIRVAFKSNLAKQKQLPTLPDLSFIKHFSFGLAADSFAQQLTVLRSEGCLEIFEGQEREACDTNCVHNQPEEFAYDGCFSLGGLLSRTCCFDKD